jgi:hypothetical protein
MPPNTSPFHSSTFPGRDTHPIVNMECKGCKSSKFNHRRHQPQVGGWCPGRASATHCQKTPRPTPASPHLQSHFTRNHLVHSEFTHGGGHMTDAGSIWASTCQRIDNRRPYCVQPINHTLCTINAFEGRFKIRSRRWTRCSVRPVRQQADAAHRPLFTRDVGSVFQLTAEVDGNWFRLFRVGFWVYFAIFVVCSAEGITSVRVLTGSFVSSRLLQVQS